MKITKRQRKAMNGPNAAVLHSLQNGDQYTVAGSNYIGRPAITDFESGKLVQKGVPFVRT